MWILDNDKEFRVGMHTLYMKKEESIMNKIFTSIICSQSSFFIAFLPIWRTYLPIFFNQKLRIHQMQVYLWVTSHAEIVYRFVPDDSIFVKEESTA